VPVYHPAKHAFTALSSKPPLIHLHYSLLYKYALVMALAVTPYPSNIQTVAKQSLDIFKLETGLAHVILGIKRVIDDELSRVVKRCVELVVELIVYHVIVLLEFTLSIYPDSVLISFKG